MIDQIVLILQGLALSFPQLTAIFAVLYVVGFAAKLIREAAEAIIAETPSQKDDAALAKVQGSVVYKWVKIALDVFLRVKPVQAAKK